MDRRKPARGVRYQESPGADYKVTLLSPLRRTCNTRETVEQLTTSTQRNPNGVVTQTTVRGKLAGTDWDKKFAPEEWVIYKAMIEKLTGEQIPFAVGGGLAAMTYAAHWRNTKDLDLYIRLCDRERVIEFTKELGLRDYYEKQGYDRAWIYRSHRGDVIVDLMWAMANQRTQVDESWFDGPVIETGGERFRLLAPEEVIWSKLYVMQRDRTDWPDCLNVLYGVGPDMNWQKLIQNVADDAPLLAGLVSAFSWLAPDRAWELPDCVWAALNIERPARSQDRAEMLRRTRLLDSRPWFFAAQENGGVPGQAC